MAISLVIADDHHVVRAGLCVLFKNVPNFRIVGEATSGREAVHLSKRRLPDIVLMDFAMPRLNGVEATRQIVKECPDIKVIVLSSYGDAAHIDSAMTAGAAAYLLKDTAASEVVRAIHCTLKGKAYVSPAISNVKASAARWIRMSQKPEELTPRETEVLQLISEGFTNKQIGSELRLSQKTVEKHRNTLMKKLNIHNIAGLTRHAVEKGITEIPLARNVFFASDKSANRKSKAPPSRVTTISRSKVQARTRAVAI